MLPPSDVEQKGWKYAAIAAIANKHKEMQTMDEEKVIEKEIEVVEPVAEEEKPVVEPLAEDPEVEEVVEELKDDEKKEDGIQAEEDELAALRAENEELKKELEALKATCEKLTAGLKTKTETKAVKKTFAELVKEIPTNISDSAYAAKFTALKQSHKAEYDAWMEAHKRR